MAHNLGSFGKGDAGRVNMQYPVANLGQNKQNAVLSTLFSLSESPDKFKSMDVVARRRSSAASFHDDTSQKQQDQVAPRTSKETRRLLQRDIQKRVAKTRMSKLVKNMDSNNVEPTAQSVKADAKSSAQKPEAFPPLKTVSELLTTLHRKNLTLQAQRDVFKWLTDFCTANKHAVVEDEHFIDKLARGESSENHPSHLRQNAQTSADVYKQKILRNCENPEWMKEPGPVGDIPIHLAFLFGEHELGIAMIDRAISTLPSEEDRLKYKHELVNRAYASDLDWWFEEGGQLSFSDNLRQLAKKQDGREALREALCTVGCDSHCPRCEGGGGKDGGLFTGETVLHIAIVQHQEGSVKWLLENGAYLHSRARGLFFQPLHIEKFESEKTDWMTHWTGRDQTQNTLGGSCYYGEYPLSFAAAVGDEHICHQLVEKAEELLDAACRPGGLRSLEGGRPTSEQGKELRAALEEWLHDNVVGWELHKKGMESGERWDDLVESELSAFVNMRDARGNTALHMAVMYEKTATVDWLLNNGAEPSMQMLNNQHLTPLTLAVRKNSVEVFQHLAKKLRSRVWAYGSVVMTITNLEQIDTFRMKSDRSGNQSEVPAGLEFRVRGVRQEQHLQERVIGMQLKLKKNSVAPADPCSLHLDPYWRSALEVVVQHEIHAFHATPMFQQLVEEKWMKFARWQYILHNMIPYALFVAFSSACIWQRVQEIIGALGKGEWDGRWGNDRWSNGQWAIAGMEFAVYVAGIPFLLVQAWRSKRLRRLDWDPNEDLEMSSEEVIFFLHKNASLMLNTVISALLLGIAGLRLQGPRGLEGWWDVDAAGHWRREMDMLALAMMLIWCNFLHQLLPFKFVGPLLITVWRMLIGDVTRWCIVFIFILVGFSQSIAILASALNVATVQSRLSQAPYSAVPDNPAEGVMFESWSFMIDYIYVSMGEVGQDFIEEHRFDGGESGSLILTMHILFIILSTLLLLNLLIALMGNTLANETSNEGFAKWWMLQAEIVLRIEERLSDKERVKYRSGDPNEQIAEDKKDKKEYFRVLVGPDDDLENDWGEARPLTNEELKAAMEEQHETTSDALVFMFKESQQWVKEFQALDNKVDELCRLVKEESLARQQRYSPPRTRSPLPSQLGPGGAPQHRELPPPRDHWFAHDDGSAGKSPEPQPPNGRPAPHVAKASVPGITIPEQNGDSGAAHMFASMNSPHNGMAMHPDSAPSVARPARNMRPLKPLPDSQQKS